MTTENDTTPLRKTVKVLFDALVDLHAETFAQSLLINELVRKISETDPKFGDKALAQIDTVLGRKAAKGDPPTPVSIKARQKLVELIDLAGVTTPPANITLPPADKPKTLRRRFLNWLQSGD
jgi:hypothetical protein